MPYISGYHAVHEALRSRAADVVRVLVAPRAAKDRRAVIEALCRKRRVRFETVSDAELARTVEESRQGFAAQMRERTLEAVGVDPDLVVLVEDVSDPRNLGALLRVCEGAGVGRVLIRDRGSAPISDTVAHTSAGATEWLPIERITNSALEIERLQQEGFWIYGAAEGGEAPWDLDLSGKVVLCIGGEEDGLRQRTREVCDGLVGLPMRGRIESLNLATAAAAILYEVVRQRRSKRS